MDQKSYEPGKIVHRLKERGRLAELMQLHFQDLSEEDEMRQRIVLINALMKLGRVEKVPSERIIPETNTKCATNNNQNSSPKKNLLHHPSRATVQSL
jgi:hypothetical protein